MTLPLEFAEHQSRVIHNIQQLLGELEEDAGEPLPRGAVISALFAVAAAVARNPRFAGEEEMAKSHFRKLAERAYAVAVRVTGGKN